MSTIATKSTPSVAEVSATSTTSHIPHHGAGEQTARSSTARDASRSHSKCWAPSTLLRSARSAFRRNSSSSARTRKPLAYAFRSSPLFAAFTVALGIFCDLACYSIAVPVIPYRLEELGYSSVSSRTGWLVAAYGIGLVISSPPMAYFGERCNGRRLPLLCCLAAMIGGILMFLLAENYALMVVARLLQGISGTGIWTLGMALICDVYPEEQIGVVFGYMMIAFSGGALVGPVAGGGLYHAFGFHAPFIFAIIIVAIDLIMRLLLIERRTELRLAQDAATAAAAAASSEADPTKENVKSGQRPTSKEGLPVESSARGETEKELDCPVSDKEVHSYPPPLPSSERARETVVVAQTPQKMSGLEALKRFARSGRAVTTLALTLLAGFAIGGPLDGGLTLYVSREYGLTSEKAGLIFIASVVPNFFISPLMGIMSDWWGAQYIVAGGHMVMAAAFGIGMIRGPLWLLVFSIGVFGVSLATFTAIMADLTKLANTIPGMGYAQAFAIWNGLYSIGTVIGPIVGNNILEGAGIVPGWRILLGITIGMATVGAAAAAVWLGQEGTKRKKEARHEV